MLRVGRNEQPVSGIAGEVGLSLFWNTPWVEKAPYGYDDDGSLEPWYHRVAELTIEPDPVDELLAEIEARILVPTVHAMRRAKVPFQGVLYAGLMLTAQLASLGKPESANSTTPW